MPTQDDTTIQGGLGQEITDWVLGDDRAFFGNALNTDNPPEIGTTVYNLNYGYFTLKKRQTDTDADSILQVAITPVATPFGLIYVDPAVSPALTALNFNVYSANYQQFVNAGTTYFWDFRVFDVNGRVYTLANGIVQFIQNTTQTEVAGTPAALPNSGNPRFRGFTQSPPALTVAANVGDWFINKYPQPGDPWGWTCVIGGSPGTWAGIGVVNDIDGTPQPILPPPSFAVAPPRFLGWIAAAPTVGGPFYVGDFYRNLFPSNDSPSGWTCTMAGSPGVWRTDGIVGETA